MSIDQYSELLEEVREVVSLTIGLSEETTGRIVNEWSHEYSSYVFTKICCHGISALRLAPTGLVPAKPGSSEVWDLSSLCAVVRALIDAYYVMYYLNLAPDTPIPYDR